MEVGVAFEESFLTDRRLPVFLCWEKIAVEDCYEVVFFVAGFISQGIVSGSKKPTFGMDTIPICELRLQETSSVRHRLGQRNVLFRDLLVTLWWESENGRRSCSLWLGGLDLVLQGWFQQRLSEHHPQQ